jgi:predicted amidohydrolase YtcJ
LLLGCPSQLRRTAPPRNRQKSTRDAKILRGFFGRWKDGLLLAADLVIHGTVLTVDSLQPAGEALAVSDGRIIAVGDRAEIESWIGPGTEVLDTGDGCVMPGFVEAHGHPLMEAIVLSDRMVDIRPVTIRGADDVVDAIRREVANRGAGKHPRRDHQLRLEHVGAIRPQQLQRAHDLGVTCSLFVDQIHYWGDVIVDGLFGPEHGERWMPCGGAVKTGMRISLHNDPPLTPEEPLRNISLAVTRTAPSGRVLAPDERLTVEQADPRTVPPEAIADLEVRATSLAGRQVYSKGD